MTILNLQVWGPRRSLILSILDSFAIILGTLEVQVGASWSGPSGYRQYKTQLIENPEPRASEYLSGAETIPDQGPICNV